MSHKTNRRGLSLGPLAVFGFSLCLAWAVHPTAHATPLEPAASAEPAPEAPPAAEQPVVQATKAAPTTAAPAPVQSVKTTQDAALLTPPPPPGTRIVMAAPGAGRAREDAAPDDPRNPMDAFGFTVRVGYSSVASGHLANPTYNRRLAEYAAMLPPATLEATGLVGGGACTPIDEKCRTAGRGGFQLTLAMDMGGSGFGFSLEPYITVGGNAFAAGMYLGPRVEIRLYQGLYLGLGLGARAAYVALDSWRHGGDIFGRIPVRVSYYVARNVALVLESSFGAGISLFVSEPVNIIDPRTNQPLANAPKIAVGAARGWDLTLGLRFP